MPKIHQHWDGSAWTHGLNAARFADPQRQRDLRFRIMQRLIDDGANEFIGQQLKRQSALEHMRTIDAYRTLHLVSPCSKIPREPCIWSSCSKREWEAAIQAYRIQLVAAHEALEFSV